MKKYLMLIITMLTALVAVAQEVQVSNLQVAAGNQITFEVSWGGSTGSPVSRTEPWSDTVWVFIDYFNMDKQEMWRLPVASATLNNTSANWVGAQVRTITENNNSGFYIYGLARTKGTGTVSVSVTPAGDYPQGVIRPCVYVTDYQPVATYDRTTDGAITATLTGTAPYSGQYDDVSVWTLSSGNTLSIENGKGIAAFADATGNSGIARCGTAGSSVTLTSGTDTQSQTVCEGSAITGTSYTIGGSATSYTLSGLPAGLTHTMDNKIITISGTPTASGTYTITTTGHTAPCEAATIKGGITVNVLPVDATVTGNTLACSNRQLSLNVTVADGSEVYWYSTPASDLPFYTGNSYLTPPVQSSGVYYAETKDIDTGCVSAGRTAVNYSVTSCEESSCYGYSAGRIGAGDPNTCEAYNAGTIGISDTNSCAGYSAGSIGNN